MLKTMSFLFQKQSALSVLSKLSRAGDANDPIQKPGHGLAFLLPREILLFVHFGRTVFWIKMGWFGS